MTSSDIYEAIMARVETLSVGSPPLPMALPNYRFDPKTDALDGCYLDINDFTNAPAWEGLTSGKISQGLLRITVVWKPGVGLFAAKVAADAVMAHFAKGTAMAFGSAYVRVTKEPVAASPIYDDIETRIPITIPWTA